MRMPSERNALWSVARECAAQRLHKYCKQEFGSMECNSCKHYIYNYTDAEPAKINLLMYKAEESTEEIVQIIRYGRRALAAMIAFMVLLPFALYWGWRLIPPLFDDKPYEPPAKTVTKTVAETVNYSDEQAIQDTLNKVSSDMKRSKDVNNDGLSNCIDAAILFYSYYPFKDKVMIYWNYNPAKDFNHLFNLVLINGNWVGVEPQAKFCGYYDTYRMTAIWKGKYDSSKNKNVTSNWLQYIK